jgi:hypothetical protein
MSTFSVKRFRPFSQSFVKFNALLFGIRSKPAFPNDFGILYSLLFCLAKQLVS